MFTPQQIRRQVRLRADELRTYSRALCAPRAEARTRFVLLANYRSGSTLLASLLNSHPEVFCDGEIFYPFIVGGPRSGKMLSPHAYVRGRENFSRGNTAYGFDLKLDQLSKVNSQCLHGPFGDLVARLHGEGWKLVHLSRRNLFRQCLSNHLARARRVWHQTEEVGLGAQRIEPEDLWRQMVRFEKLAALETECLRDLPRLELVYERDLLAAENHGETAGRVFAHLGLGPAPVKTALRKVSAPHPARDVLNYEELAAFIRGTRFAAFVDA